MNTIAMPMIIASIVAMTAPSHGVVARATPKMMTLASECGLAGGVLMLTIPIESVKTMNVPICHAGIAGAWKCQSNHAMPGKPTPIL